MVRGSPRAGGWSPPPDPLGEAGSLRAPLSLHLSRPVLAGAFVAYVLLQAWALGRTGRLGNPWGVANALLTPAAHVAAFALVAPLPWLVARHRRGLLAWLGRAALALVVSEATVLLLVGLDWMTSRHLGLGGHLRILLRMYALIVGPVLMVLGALMAGRARALAEKQALAREVRRARSRLLQSQLHPHVLFNALNGLAELIHRDPPAAERSVAHLADLLRRTLRASEHGTLPLGEERALVEDHLHLAGIRLGDRLRVSWDWDPGLDALQVPPLLVQPLVENALKHGIAPCRTGGELRIRARAEGRDLRLEVWNTGAGLEPEAGGGVGLRNLEARLALACPGARFVLEARDGGTLAALRLPGLALPEAP